MSTLSPDVLESFANLQDQVWQDVASAVTGLSETPVQFRYQQPECVPPETARALAGERSLAITFAFSSSVDHEQLLVLNPDSFKALAGAVKGEEVVEPEETLIPDIREFLEGIVQGICQACGTARNEPMLASNLSIRFQALALPENFGRNDDLVQVEISLSGADLEGTLSWFLDRQTVELVCGNAEEAEAAESETAAAEKSSPDLMTVPEAGGLELLRDIPLEISVELGRVKMLVKEVLDLGAGSIVEINKAAGEPVDVLVNGRLVARGEVVVVEDNFGVRITEILNSQERLTRLGEAA